MPDPRAADTFIRLVDIMARLRAPGGCPWDREQTWESLRPYLLEETHEVLDAIADGDPAAVRDELGDLLLQIVFQAEIAAEAGHFTIADVATAIADKLVRRHPHVFGDVTVHSADEVVRRSSGRRTVPQIFIDGRAIGGYDELAALDAAGELAGLGGDGTPF